MTVKRIVANIAGDPDDAHAFYGELLGLDIRMDMGWIRTYGSSEGMTVQMSVMTQGGSDSPVPDLSIEVDDVDAVLEKARAMALPITYGPTDEPWGVRRFFVRDPFGKLVNILSHTDG